jgi:serine/threonine protein kinase
MIASAEGPDELPKVPGFQLERELGRGGVGVVYQAIQLDLNRRVALKMLLSKAHSSASETQRFHGEAAAMATLQHPNLVTVYHIGRHDGLPFIVMEYLNGGTLAERPKPFPISEAVQLSVQLADAVGYCHEHGVIHRDLKPANILFNQDGTPKVTDFGMAKRLEQTGELTTSGTMLGTPNYMAPEQAHGLSKTVSATADVWSLGILLYELCTGKRPFAGNTLFETLEKVQKGQFETPRTHRPDIPEGVERIILQCLQVNPLNRYPTGKELAADLRRWQAGQAIVAEDLTALLKPSHRTEPPPARVTLFRLFLLSGALLGISLVFLLSTGKNTLPTSSSAHSEAVPTSFSPATSVQASTPPASLLEVAPLPLALPSSPAAQAEYARTYWWEAIHARPLSRKTRLLEAAISGLQQARQTRDGQTARHHAWLGVIQLSLASPNLAAASRELTQATQANDAESEPLVPLLRGLIERKKLLSIARPGQPIDLMTDVGNLSLFLNQLRQALSKSAKADRVEDTAVVTWFAVNSALELVELDQSSPRLQRRLCREVQGWLDSAPAKSWPTTEQEFLRCRLYEVQQDFDAADAIIRTRLTADRNEPDWWLLRGRLYTNWGTHSRDTEKFSIAEKALIQARSQFEPQEATQRVECLYWLGRAFAQWHELTQLTNENLDFDPHYLQGIRSFQDALNLATSPETVPWFERASFELPLLHVHEATRLLRNPTRAKEVFSALDSTLRRATVAYRDPARGLFEVEKLELRRALGSPPSGAGWLADLQSAVDLGTQPGALTQDRSLQATVQHKLAQSYRNKKAYPKEFDETKASDEAEKAVAIIEATELLPATLKASIYAWLGDLSYQVAYSNRPDSERVPATQKAILNLRKALELGAAFPDRWKAKLQLAILQLGELTAGKDVSRDLLAHSRVWFLIREIRFELGNKPVPDAEAEKRLSELFADFSEIRITMRQQLQQQNSLAEIEKLFVEIAILEMDLSRGTPIQIEQAKQQLKAILPRWKSLEIPDNARGETLRLALKRLEQLQ